MKKTFKFTFLFLVLAFSFSLVHLDALTCNPDQDGKQTYQYVAGVDQKDLIHMVAFQIGQMLKQMLILKHM